MFKICKKEINPSKWGTERATIELLSDSDRKWVSLRYQFILDYISNNDVVLDAACGSGFGSEILARKAQKVIGIDISKEAITYARQKYNNDKIEFIKSNVYKLPFKDNYFDSAIGIETIEHVKKYDQYLNELARVTNNNGLIIITTPQKKSEVPLTPYHVHEFTFNEFKKELQKHFIIKEIYGLIRHDTPRVEKIEDQYCQYDIYLAICSNRKYVLQDYNDDYFKAVHNGININPVAEYHYTAVANSIIGPAVLSIGCGTCTYERSITMIRSDIILTGTDIYTSDYLDKLRKENGLHSFIKVSESKNFRQPFQDNSFDTVYTSHVLEHVQKPERLILESLRLTRCIAMHLVPINLDNPDHINFFRYGDIDNPYKTQEASIDLEQMCEEVVADCKRKYPKLYYEMELVNPRDGSIDYGDTDFIVKRTDRPDGLMPCFLIKFYKNGLRS